MTTTTYDLYYFVYGSENQYVGNVWITYCPDLDLIDQLDNYGDEGYYFLEAVETLFGHISKIELDYHQPTGQPRAEGPETCTIPWSLIYHQVEEE
jgi:hypothetical protein